MIRENSPRLVDLITDPDRLTDELWAAKFIGNTVKDTILTTNLSNMAKARKLVHEVYVYFCECDDRQKMETFCNILRKTCNPAIERVIDEILSTI